MSFYIYQLVEQLILPNTLINLSAINYKISTINHHASTINYMLSANLSIIRYFY